MPEPEPAYKASEHTSQKVRRRSTFPGFRRTKSHMARSRTIDASQQTNESTTPDHTPAQNQTNTNNEEAFMTHRAVGIMLRIMADLYNKTRPAMTKSKSTSPAASGKTTSPSSSETPPSNTGGRSPGHHRDNQR